MGNGELLEEVIIFDVAVEEEMELSGFGWIVGDEGFERLDEEGKAFDGVVEAGGTEGEDFFVGGEAEFFVRATEVGVVANGACVRNYADCAAAEQ